jgi:hypothetical protein
MGEAEKREFVVRDKDFSWTEPYSPVNFALPGPLARKLFMPSF